MVSPKGMPWALVMGTVWHQSPVVLLLVQPAVTSAPPVVTSPHEEVVHSPMVMLPHELHDRQYRTRVLGGRHLRNVVWNESRLSAIISVKASMSTHPHFCWLKGGLSESNAVA